MAINYYEGWSEADLLAERLMVQKQLSSGRITEVRLAGELTRTDHASDYTPLEMTLERISYALFAGMPWPSGNQYKNPLSYQPGVTRQSFC
jgi:hypothetical protein